MKILSVIAQKPNSTGSGIYLSELSKYIYEEGHKQEIICAVYEDEVSKLVDSENIKYQKVVFNTSSLPMKIAGMSDVMPYESIKYSDLAKDDALLKLWKDAFYEKIKETIDEFNPDLIICHHLYLLTAMVVDYVNNKLSDKPKVFGICHNTDLRQFKQTNLCREYIKENISKLDKIFAPSIDHKEKIVELFGIKNIPIDVIGIGFNSEIFYNRHLNRKENKLLYVGKISKKKGVLSLIKAVNQINDKNLELDLIGGAGDKFEYEEIFNETKLSRHKIKILPPKSQIELAEEYNTHSIFILPSFSEGIPIVPLEAMACGSKLVISDLPGVKSFYDENVKNASIKYVELPKMTNVDDASDEELKMYEKRLAVGILESLNDDNIYEPNLKNISWENISKKILKL